MYVCCFFEKDTGPYREFYFFTLEGEYYWVKHGTRWTQSEDLKELGTTSGYHIGDPIGLVCNAAWSRDRTGEKILQIKWQQYLHSIRVFSLLEHLPLCWDIVIDLKRLTALMAASNRTVEWEFSDDHLIFHPLLMPGQLSLPQEKILPAMDHLSEITREEIARYKDEYCPAAVCEFLRYNDDSGENSYAGALLTVSSSRVEDDYNYKDAYIVATTSEGQVFRALVEGLTQVARDERGLELSDGVDVVGYDLVATYRILSERTDRLGFAKRVVLDTLRYHRKNSTRERFYVYLQLNAMVMGITAKNEHQRTQEELIEWYYPRVVRYLSHLDKSQYTDTDANTQHQYVIRPYVS